MRVAALLSIAVVAFGSGQVNAQSVVPIEVTSLATNFVTKGRFTGRVEVHAESLVVIFDSTLIAQAEYKGGRSSYQLDSLTIGLATRSGRSFKILQKDAGIAVPDSVAERTSFSLGALRGRLDRTACAKLDDCWITVTFHQMLIGELVPPGMIDGGSTTYAHSSSGVFAKLKQ